MALTAEQIIESARDAHSAFDRKRNPDPILLRALARYERELLAKVMEIDETVLVTDQVVALPLGDHEAGIALTPNRSVVGVTAKSKNSTPERPLLYPIDVIPYESRHDPNSPFDAAWEYGDKLYLRSPASAWNQMSEIAIALTPKVTAPTGLNSVLTAPDEAENALVTKVALFMANRGHTDPALPPINVNAFVAQADEAQRSYLEEVINRIAGQPFPTRDVWRGSWR